MNRILNDRFPPNANFHYLNPNTTHSFSKLVKAHKQHTEPPKVLLWKEARFQPRSRNRLQAGTCFGANKHE